MIRSSAGAATAARADRPPRQTADLLARAHLHLQREARVRATGPGRRARWKSFIALVAL